MADDFDLDFGDFSPDYDLNFDFGSNKTGAKPLNRKKGDVVRDFAAGIWEGAKLELGSYGAPTRLIKSILPRSYGPALDTVDRTLRFKDDLYDKVREETKDSVTEFKELTREAMGIYGNKVPEKLAKSLEAWANSNNNAESWRDYVTDDGPKLDVDASSDELLDAFTHGSAANAELSQAQHTELMAGLAAGAVANQKGASQQAVLLDQLLTMNRRLVGYNETMNSTYQRRSLEIQFRHYRLDISVARMREQYYKRSLEAFSSMITNSSMTDMEKASKSKGHNKLVNKMYGTGRTASTISRYGNHLMDSAYEMVGDAAANKNLKYSSTAAALGAAMRAGQAAKMSGQMGGARGRGAMVGSALAGATPFLLQQLLRNRLEKNGGANGLGHNLSYYGESAPGLINGWLRNRKQLDEDYDEFDPKNKWYTRLQKGVLNPLVNNALFKIPISQGNKTRVQTPGIKDLMQPAQWDMMSRRSLVEVIPGLLTQQLTVQQKLLAEWSGEKPPAEQAFNHRQGGFTSKARVKADIRASVFNRSEFQSAAGSFNSMVEAIDPDEELSGNARVALAMRFARDSDAGDGFNINNYLSADGWINAEPETIREINDFLHKRFETKESEGKAKILGKYQIGDTNEVAELRKTVANNMQSQQNYMPNVEDSVNSLANGGQRAMLKEMGIIQRVNGQEVFNHDMYWKMMEKFISNPNFRPDMEEGEKDPRDPGKLEDRLDSGALGDLKDKAKDKIKERYDDSGLSDIVDRAKDSYNDNARDKVNDLLGRGKGAAQGAADRLKASMTREALNKLYDNAIAHYDDLVTQLQALGRSGKEVDIRAGIEETKRRAKKSIEHIRSQLNELKVDELGEDAYNAAKEQGERVIKSLEDQVAKLDIANLRSNVDTNILDPVSPIADTVEMNSRLSRSQTPPVNSPKGSTKPDEAATADEEPDAGVVLASEQNDLLRELIAVSASSRDQMAAAKDATIAQITGDPSLLSAGVEERKGFAGALGKRMQSREAKRLAGVLGLGRAYSSGVFTLTKWATIGPAILGFKAAKGLIKFMRKKKDKEVGDVDGDGIRENSWMDQLRKKRNKPPEEPKTDKNGEVKEKPTSLWGMIGGIFTAVSGLFGGIKKFGILGGLANFLNLGWVGTIVGGLGKILGFGKAAADGGSDIMDDVGDLLGDDEDRDNGDHRPGERRTKKQRRSAARERLARRNARNRPRGGILKRGAKWVARKVLGEPGSIAGRARWLVSGGAKTLAKRIPVIGSLAMSGFEMYNSYQDGDGQGMAEAAGGGIGGALGGAAMGAAVGSVIPIVGTAIGGIVGAGIGALAGSAVGASIYKWINSPGLLQQMRLYQYGLDSIKSDFTGKIFALEAGLEPYVRITDSGKATLDPKTPLAELAKPFIQDPNSQDEVQAFGGWFIQRFKPVFLTHFAVAKQMFPSSKFSDIDSSNDNAAKYEMAKRCQDFDPTIDHPYRWTGMLFNTQPAINYDITVKEVADVVEKLKAQVKKTDKDVKSTSLMLTGNEQIARAAALDKGVIDAIKPVDGSKLKGANLDGTTTKMAFGQEMTIVSVQDVLGSILPKKGEALDDLTAARMKIYGLPNLDTSKVSVLLQLELVVQNRITINGRGVRFAGKTKEVFDIMASSFGHGWMSSFAFKSWSTWFSRRFLPAYLAFVSTTYNQTGDDKPTMGAMKLPPETKLAIINSMTAQTYSDGRNELNIWTVSASPWDDLDTSNTDATILDVHINNLKQLARTAQYTENAMQKGKDPNDGTTDKDWRKDSSTGLNTNNTVKGSDGLARTSTTQETTFDPKTGQTGVAYGGGQMGANGAAGTGTGGGLDTTGKVEPLKMGPGTEEGTRAMIRQAAKAGVTDKKELAILLANTYHETGGYKQVEENLRYKPQTLMKLWPHRFPSMDKAAAVAAGGPVTIANTIYGNRMGNENPGDGYKYRGRGFIQLTGKDNYERASKALGVNLVDDPDQIAEDPEMAASSALYFWKANKNIGEQARAGNVAGVRKIVNGGTIGLEDTQKLSSQFMQELNSGKYDDILSGKDKGDTGTTSDGGPSMEDLMGQSAEEQAKVEGTPPEGSAPAGAATPPPAAAAAAPAPAGSTTNAAPTGPDMSSTTGPSSAATTNADSVTPNAPDSTTSATEAPGSAAADPVYDKTAMQTQSDSKAPTAVPVTMDVDDTHVKATAANTATTNDKLDEMIKALNLIAETNKSMANQPPAQAPVGPAVTPQQTQQAVQSNPVGSTNSNISLRRNF